MCLTLAKIIKDSDKKNNTLCGKVPKVLNFNMVIEIIVFSVTQKYYPPVIFTNISEVCPFSDRLLALLWQMLRVFCGYVLKHPLGAHSMM